MFAALLLARYRVGVAGQISQLHSIFAFGKQADMLASFFIFSLIHARFASVEQELISLFEAHVK